MKNRALFMKNRFGSANGIARTFTISSQPSLPQVNRQVHSLKSGIKSLCSTGESASWECHSTHGNATCGSTRGNATSNR